MPYDWCFQYEHCVSSCSVIHNKWYINAYDNTFNFNVKTPLTPYKRYTLVTSKSEFHCHSCTDEIERCHQFIVIWLKKWLYIISKHSICHQFKNISFQVSIFKHFILSMLTGCRHSKWLTRPSWNFTAFWMFVRITKCCFHALFLQIYNKCNHLQSQWQLKDRHECTIRKIAILTHCGRDKMADILQTTFSNAFSLMKMFEMRLKFNWRMFLRVQLTMGKRYFR